TSSTLSPATPACSTAAWMAVLPSWVAGTPVNWPSRAPRAVRLAPAMTTLDMTTPGNGGNPHYSRPLVGGTSVPVLRVGGTSVPMLLSGRDFSPDMAG